MQTVEAAFAELLREFKALAASLGSDRLPAAMTKRRAARELDVSQRTLEAMIRRGEIGVCLVGKRCHIPRSEVLRIAEVSSTTTRRRATPARRRPAKDLETSEDEKIRELIRRKD